MVTNEQQMSSFRWQAAVFTGSVLLYLLVRFTLDGTVTVTGSMLFTPSAGLAIPLGMLFGIPAAAGIMAGAIFAPTLLSGFELQFLFEALSLLSVGVVSSLAWRSQYAPGPGLVDGFRGWCGLFVVLSFASLVGAAIFAWGAELLGALPFYVAFADSLLRYGVGGIVVAPPILLGSTVLSEQSGFQVRTTTRPPIVFGTGFFLLPLAWSVLAVVGSIGFGIRERIPQFVFEGYGIGVAYNLVHPDIFGAGGRRVQVVFGALMLVAWIGVVVAGKKDPPDEDISAAGQADDTVMSATTSNRTGTRSTRSNELEGR